MGGWGGRGPVQQEWSCEVGDHRGANLQTYFYGEGVDKLPSNIGSAMRCPAASTYIQFIDSREKILSFDICGPKQGHCPNTVLSPCPYLSSYTFLMITERELGSRTRL